MSGSADEPPYLEIALGSFLELVSAAEAAPGGGSAAAIAVGLAAGLLVMAARLSTGQLPDAPDLAVAAERLRDRAAALCQADADAYRRFMSALHAPCDPDPEDRWRQIAAALLGATDVPLEVVEIGASVAGLAARIAEGGNPNLLGDAVTAALLAESGARAAAALVLINLKGLQDDDRRNRVAKLVEEAAESAGRARRRVEP
ncbi:MAG: cyclodeaminase/cyclohydrolase family protein [Acidimicrobiales bacterium]